MMRVMSTEPTTPEQKAFMDEISAKYGQNDELYFAIHGTPSEANPARFHFKVTSNMTLRALIDITFVNLRNELGPAAFQEVLLAQLEKELGATIVMAEMKQRGDGDADVTKSN